MKMLMEDIKNRQFKKIYLLTGEEVYLRNQYRKRLREALIDPEDTMNCSVFEGGARKSEEGGHRPGGDERIFRRTQGDSH